MKAFIFFFVIVVCFAIYKLLTKGGNREGDNGQRTNTSRTDSGHRPSNRPTSSRSPSPQSRPVAKDTYRPSTRTLSGIQFNNVGSGQHSAGAINSVDLQDLCDAFTGEKLDINKGLYRCEKCKVHYHKESYDVLRSENNGACVACGSTNLIALTQATVSATSARNYDPSVVSMSNLKSHIGRVVTFEGFAHKVRVSQRGTDYAVMFEQKSWKDGFKLVFFRGSIRKVGGPNFINSLNQRTIRVRGLLIDHPTFGLEIIVSERSMIHSIK